MTVDRKAVLRDYKERLVPMGVYRVICTVTGDQLVAASRDTKAILNRHLAQLRLSAHPNKALQSAWAAHGAASFQFEVLDELSPSDDATKDPTDDLVALEDMWLEKLSVARDPLHTIRLKRR